MSKKHKTTQAVEGSYNDLLHLIATVPIPARTEKFVAKDNFVVDTGKKARVKISYLGDNFRKHFLGKNEEPASEITLSCHKLKKFSRDIPIISELGGKDKAETTLFAMFALMEMQPSGGIETLLTNGKANIFYIRDLAGVLWAVFCYWRDGGWGVGASSVGSPLVWGGGDLAFSCNS